QRQAAREPSPHGFDGQQDEGDPERHGEWAARIHRHGPAGPRRVVGTVGLHGRRRSTIVAPLPPSDSAPSRNAATSGCRERWAATAWRSAPVPLPWMTVTRLKPARVASSRYLCNSSIAFFVVSPRKVRDAVRACD